MGWPAKSLTAICRMGSSPIFSEQMFNYHSHELRYRFYYYVFSVFVSTLIVFEYKYNLLFSLCPIELIFTELYEAFTCFIWFSVGISLICSFPYLCYSCLCFIMPGLYLHEKVDMINMVKRLGLLFVLILTLYVKYLLPFAVFFFTGFMSDHLICSIKLVDFIGFLTHIGYLSLGTTIMLLLGFHIKLLEIRKWVYSLLLLVIGLVTPPDIVSLILIWVPLIVMLEFGYYLSVVKMKIGLNPQSFLWCLYLTV